jgi:hypothetical protein
MARYNTQAALNSVSASSSINSTSQGTYTEIGTSGVTVTLPLPSASTGIQQVLYNTSAGSVTISGNGGNIQGPGITASTSYTLASLTVITLVSDGSAYTVINENGGPLAATTITASSTVSLSPANASVTASPTGSGTVTINPATAGTIDNMAIGGTTAAAGKFTSLSASGTTTVHALLETATIAGTSMPSTVTYYVQTQTVLYYNVNSTTNATLNLAGSGSVTMNNTLAIGQSVTVALLNQNGSTGYYISSIQVDGTTSGVTVHWQGGTAPTTGNSTATDIYTFTVIKTANATYAVLASQTKFS